MDCKRTPKPEFPRLSLQNFLTEGAAVLPHPLPGEVGANTRRISVKTKEKVLALPRLRDCPPMGHHTPLAFPR